MLLTITYTGRPATDLGYLLHKNPARLHSLELAFGRARVFYPEATEERCTAALLLEINPVDLARNYRNAAAEPLYAYVNDRPYAASSFLSVALARVFGTAMSGRSKERQALAEQELPLQARLVTLSSRGGAEILERLFLPLGYELTVTGHPLDEAFQSWGQSRYYTVTLSACCRLADLLNHLYVLIPVLDVQKHYWIGEDEIDKLLRHGEGWLAAHPERELIARRYLKRRPGLAQEALRRLLAEEEPDLGEAEADPGEEARDEEGQEKHLNLNEHRLGTVISALKNLGAKCVLDLGCGEGKLVERLLRDNEFREIAGMDVSYGVLERARDRLRLDRLPPLQKERIQLFQGSLTYLDQRFEGYDAVTVIEVIEHLDPGRLAACERVLFASARPPAIVITTPNREYNERFPGLAGKLRHKDHRFEWTRAEFRTWAEGICQRHGYHVSYLSVGDEDRELGPPTQMGVFTR